MASKRRGGFRPPELRGTLGTLLRTTTDVVRGALERGAREGRARLDDARAHRRRQDALIELGELVLDLIRRGEIDLTELPEARDLVRQLDDLDADTSDEPEPPPARAATRSRFDDRARPGPSRVPAARDDDDDGTVASGATLRASRPTTPGRPRDSEVASSRAPTKPLRGRDPSADAPAASSRDRRSERDPRADRSAAARASSADHAPSPDPPPPPRRPTLPPDPHRKGGISFDDDDLADYMHPDDVPSKDPAGNPGDGEP